MIRLTSYITPLFYGGHFLYPGSCFPGQYMYRYHFLHPGLLNPAVTGSEYFPLANLTYQKQWVGIPQSPHTMWQVQVSE